MKLTIGIPNYNGGELLKNTILSVNNNLILDKNKYEILVVDNCSNDNSIEIIKELQKKIENIRLVRNNKNYGRIGNWNRVLDLSKGEIILVLMVGDKLLKFNYNKYFSDLEEKQHLVFGVQIGGEIKTHWAQEKNIFLDSKYILKVTILTIGHNYGLTPLQTHFLSKDIIIKYNLKFDEEFEFLADLKFLNKYITYIDYVNFVDKGIIKWWDGKNKTTFKKQLLMFKDFLNYFPKEFENNLEKSINTILFKSFIVNQILFIYINNKKLGISGFSFLELINFIKKDINNSFYFLTLIFFPIYIVYLYINLKNNFRFALYFN